MMTLIRFKKWFIYGVVGSMYCGNLYAKEEKEVKVQSVPKLEYEYKNDLIKSKEGYLIYKGTIFISLEEILTLLEINYRWQPNKLEVLVKDMRHELEKDIQCIYYNNGRIKEIDKTKGIMKISYTDAKENEQIVTLAITEETQIKHSLLESVFPMEVLKTNMHINAKTLVGKLENGHSVALKIEIMESNNEISIQPNIKNAKIIEINEKEQYLLIEVKDNAIGIQKIMVHIDHNTNIIEQDTGIAYTLKQLKSGMHIDIKTNSILTNSAPAHTLGLEITVVK